jgi:hypothetical protein
MAKKPMIRFVKSTLNSQTPLTNMSVTVSNGVNFQGTSFYWRHLDSWWLISLSRVFYLPVFGLWAMAHICSALARFSRPWNDK